MTLAEQQYFFFRLLVRFFRHVERYAEDRGYMVTVRDLWRDPEIAKRYATSGVGIADSLHCDSLAVDILLRTPDGKLVNSLSTYAPLGRRWKRYDESCRWGGDFESRPDPGHFSLSRGGRA